MLPVLLPSICIISLYFFFRSICQQHLVFKRLNLRNTPIFDVWAHAFEF